MSEGPPPGARGRGLAVALQATAVLAVLFAAGGYAPFLGPRPPLGEAGWPALLLVALLAVCARRGVAAAAVPLGRWLADGLRRLDARRLVLPYLGFVAATGAFAMRRYSAFEAHAYDLAIFDQAIWATSQGKFLFSSLKGDIVLLGDHFSPILALFAPIYWIGGGARALVFAQAVILGLGAFPLLRLSRRLLGPSVLGGLLPLAYLAGAPLRNLTARDFHPEIVAVPVLLFAICALHERRLGWAWAAVPVVLACKETSALALVGLGLYAAFAAGARRTGLAMAAVGVVAFAVEVKLVLPWFAGQATPYTGRYGHLGSSLGEVLLAPVRHPVETLSLLVWPGLKLEGLARMFAPFGFLGLFAPAALLGAAPNYLANAMASYPPMHSVTFHYHAEMIAFFAAAAVLGAARFRERWPSRREVAAAVVAVCAVAQVGWPEPARVWATPVTARSERIEAHLAAIPADAAVAADTRTAVHLAHRLRLFHFPDRVERAEYVAVDERVVEHAWHVTPEGRAAALAAVRAGGFDTLVEDDGFYIFRRRAGASAAAADGQGSREQ